MMRSWRRTRLVRPRRSPTLQIYRNEPLLFKRIAGTPKRRIVSTRRLKYCAPAQQRHAAPWPKIQVMHRLASNLRP